MKYPFFVFCLYLLCGFQLNAQSLKSNLKLPYDKESYVELEQTRSAYLQSLLENEISANEEWSQLVEQKKMAVSLVDLRDPCDVKFASINGDHMMYAASLPKIAVLLTAMEMIDKGKLTLTPDVDNDMRIMIAKSNNGATTRMIERIGFDAIAKTLRSDKYRLYNKQKGGGLWVGKKYAASGKKNPDPLKGLSHAATADQVARFYTMLAYGKLVNTEASEEMLTYMGNPELHHKFVNTLEKLSDDLNIYRKSGSWRNYHSDSALVFGDDGRKYILVALIEDPSGGQICKQLVYSAERALGINKSQPLASNLERGKNPSSKN